MFYYLIYIILIYKNRAIYLIKRQQCVKLILTRIDIKGVYMSRAKNRVLFLGLLIMLFSIFAFGCEDKVAVESIYFNEESIVLLVGESFSPKVIIEPTYATNQSYTISSLNAEIVTVSENTLVAKKTGTTFIRVVSSDNELKEDMIKVNVRHEQIKLLTPRNLAYDSSSQIFKFDAVENAVGYEIKINDTTFKLGNITKFALKEYDEYLSQNGLSAFDRDLTVEVRALHPEYTTAYIDSDYSSSIRIHQAKTISSARIYEGGLQFEKVTNSNEYRLVYVTNGIENILSTTSETRVDLTHLNEKFASSTGVLKIYSLVDTDKKVNPLTRYYDSLAYDLNVEVLPTLHISLSSSMLAWNSIAGVNKYDIYLDNSKIDSTLTNEYDLRNYSRYDEIINRIKDYELRVEPSLDKNTSNLLKSSKHSNIVYFNRIATPNLSLNNNSFVWAEVNNATEYNVTLKYTIDEEERVVSILTHETSFSIEQELYPSGAEYTMTIYAVNTTNREGVQYLPSFTNSKSVFKQNKEELNIENYTLSFDSVLGDRYRIQLDNTIIDVITADANAVEYDLSDSSFTAGKHEIYVTHLGDNISSVDGNPTKVDFVQLERINDISVVENVVNVTRSAINADATIRLNIAGNGIDFDIGDTTFTLNSEKSDAEHYLPAGAYTLAVYIIGDGKNTFSVKEDGELISSATFSFNVLSAPIINNLDKDKEELHFDVIAGSVRYDIYELLDEMTLLNSVTTNYFDEFEISDGERRQFAVQAIGNGSSSLNSIISDTMSVYRLATPTTMYDSTNDSFTIPEISEQERVLLSHYEFKLDGIVQSYEFGTKFSNLNVNTNNFTLKAIAVDGKANESYLNSSLYAFDVLKIDNSSSVSINNENQLVIMADNQSGEYSLELTFVVGDQEVVVSTDNGVLTNEDKSIELNYSYLDNTYVIDLLKSDYTPIIEGISEVHSFAIRYRFIAPINENEANSDTTELKNIYLLEKSTFAMTNRDGQNIVFTNVEAWRGVSDYSLLINGEYVLSLDESTIIDSDSQTIKVDIGYIYDNTPSEKIKDINTIAVITMNVDSSIDTPKLSVVSDSIKVALGNAIVLQANKNNSASNNSVIVSFDMIPTAYTKTYNVKLYSPDYEGIEAKLLSFVDEAGKTKVEFNLDDYSDKLGNEIYISAQISTSGDSTIDGERVFIFNSLLSNELHFTKINQVQDIRVDNGVLTFEPVENAVGYDIYRVDGAKLEKLNKNGLLITNRYDVSSMEGDFNVKIRAVSKVGDYTNSILSNQISVHKLATPIVVARDGNIVITLSNSAAHIMQNTMFDGTDLSVLNGVVLNVSTIDKNLYLTPNNDGVELIGTELIVDPIVLLNYGISGIIKENLQFKLCANYISEETCYLNSNIVTFEAYGIFEPYGLDKTSTTDGSNEHIEHISWNDNDKNVLDSQNVTYGYIFKIVSGDNVYYSTDNRLKYKTSDLDYASYNSVIMGNNAIFPYGYDLNDDGEIEEYERFRSGRYAISVRAVPKDLGDKNLLSSRFSAEFTVEIMASPELMTRAGAVVWQAVPGATDYYVRVYDLISNQVVASVTQSILSLDFTTADFVNLVGVYGVTVQALSDNKTIINSVESPVFEVFRMNEVDTVEIDDGNLVLTVNKYFTEAEIEFIDSATGRIERIYYQNKLADENLDNLSIIKWTGLSVESRQKLTETIRHVVKVGDSDILNIMGNRNYKLNVRLIGNSLSYTGIVSSNKTMSVANLNAIKLATGLFEVSKGVFSYYAKSEYQNIDLNYNFASNSESSIDALWNNILIYKVMITSANASFEFYTIDYNLFINAVDKGLISTDKYRLISDQNDLYALVQFNDDDTTYQFNVYVDNKINLKNYDFLYYYPYVDESGEWSSINFGQGGSFVVEFALLGGDSLIEKSGTAITSHTAYLTSNINSSGQFVRYKDINSTISTSDGVLIFEDLLPRDDSDNIIDYPVYRLTFTPINTTDTKIVYMYYNDMGEEYARSLAIDEDALFVPINYAVDIANRIMFNMSEYFEAGTYLVDVRTLAGSGNSEIGSFADYLLNARVPSTNRTIYKISSSDVEVVNGKLHLDMGVVDSNQSVIEEYEITISTVISGEIKEFVYYINRYSEGVTFDMNNKKIIYEIPSILGADGNELIISNGNTYSIKIRGLARDNINVVDATYLEQAREFTLSQGVSDVRIENGKLKWKVLDKDNYLQSVIKVNFLDENHEIKTILITTPGIVVNALTGEYEYSFIDSDYIIEGTNTTSPILFGIDYTISIRTLGKMSLLDSNYSDGISANRLQSVPESSIRSLDGVLIWNTVSDVDKYLITLENESNTYIYTTRKNNLDFKSTISDSGEMLPAGKYALNIRAIGNSIITSILTNSTHTFTRLDLVDNIAVSTLDGNFVTWSPSENAQGYKVYFTQNNELVDTVIINAIDGTRVAIPEDITGKFGISIEAIGIGEGYVFNGDAVDYTGSFERPVAVGGISYDNENNRYYFKADDFLAGDKLRISYDIREYSYNNASVVTLPAVRVIVEYTYSNAPFFMDGNNKYYYYAPSAMGEYLNFAVQIDRNGLYSSTSPASNMIFNIFAFGDGSENKPYGINSVDHLLNIYKKPSSHYMMYGAVDMSSIDMSARIDRFGAVLASEFTGVFDGKGCALYGFDNITLDNKTSFAMFGNLKGATIKNLNFGIETNTMTITNTFAKATSGVVRLSMLSLEANDSTIENVTLGEVKFVIAGSGSLTGGVYIAGLVAQATDSAILGAITNVKVEFNATASSSAYVAGIVGRATNSMVESSAIRDSSSRFAFSQGRAEVQFNYIGGAVAYMSGTTGEKFGVYNTSVEFNITSNFNAQNIGGVVGFATRVNIEKCIVSGEVKHTGMSGNVSLGGITGTAQDSTIKSCEISLNFNLRISNYSSLKIGAVSGFLTASNNSQCIVDDCVIAGAFVDKTEYTNNSISNMGIYGDSSNNVMITNCREK